MLCKKYIIAFSLFALFFNVGCKKSELDLSNPNEPGVPSLNSEEGILRAGLGIYDKGSGLSGADYLWLAQSAHNAMGDVVFISAGNFSWRWANQPTRIILDDGSVLLPPQGTTQGAELKARNDRSFGYDNLFNAEWSSAYGFNNQANLILDIVNGSELQLTGNVEAKKTTLRAWAYWWKGFAYSRIGSMYVSGIITDKLNESNSDFKVRTEIIAEANKNFDKATEALNAITDMATYTAVMERLIPSFTKKGRGGVMTPAAWMREINTYKARNILVNKKVTEMTAEDWNKILALTAVGLQPADKILTMRTADVDDLVGQTAWTPYRVLTNQWEFLSERWVQEFKAGDARRTRNIITKTSPIVNNSGRGFQYGTRWELRPIEDGGDYVSTEAGLAEIPLGTTYEENALTRAEALIMTGSIEQGLQLIDQVRQYQNAQLAPVAGTGLSQAAAMNELYRERRIGLFLKGTAFYDYRRFGYACKDCQRTGTVVLGPGGAVNTNATIVYNYMDYFDVPLNELDFNIPATGSAAVVFAY